MPKRFTDYRTGFFEELSDPQVASHYLSAALEDSNEMFLKALRNVAKARRMSIVAEEADVSRESLYRTLSEEGNPRLSTLSSILKVLGLRIIVGTEETVHASGGPPPPVLGEKSSKDLEPPVTLGEEHHELVGIENLLARGSGQTFGRSGGVNYANQ